MPPVELKRSTAIDFTFTAADGVTYEETVPAISVGQYRAVLALEANVLEHEQPVARMDRLREQALILVGEEREAFIDKLDPEQLVELIQSLIAIFAGMDANAILEVQRGLKKKSLLEAVISARTTASASATD